MSATQWMCAWCALLICGLAPGCQGRSNPQNAVTTPDVEASAVPDEIEDAAVDTHTQAETDEQPDAAVFELGMPCEESGELACAGHDSPLVIVCSSGMWSELNVCDASERCDARPGRTQGQCLPLAQGCADRSPRARFCDGDARVTCGSDRVSATRERCAEGHLCVDHGGGVSCEPDVNECEIDSDGCDRDPEACINTLGGFICACPAGFEGTGIGPDGCTDIDECSIGPRAACGEDAVECKNEPGGHTCSCGSDSLLSADGKHCRSAAWTEPSRISAERVGWTTAPSLAVNEAGHAVAAWIFYDGDTHHVWVNEYVTDRGWSRAAQLEYNSGVAESPSVSIDAAGFAVVTWQQVDATSTHVWASEKHYSGSWSSPTRLNSPTAVAARRATADIDDQGNAMAVWEQTADQQSDIWANYFRAGEGWQGGVRIELDDTVPAYFPSIVMNADGSGFASWQQGSGPNARAFVARYTRSPGWSIGLPIDTGSAAASAPTLSFDGLEDGLAIWTQVERNTGLRSLWASFYTSHVWQYPSQIEPSSEQGFGTAMAMNDSRDVMIVGHQRDPAGDQMWAKRHTLDHGWGPAVPLDPRAIGTIWSCSVAIDDLGNAVAVWAQHDSGPTRVWASRHSAANGWGRPVILSEQAQGIRVGMDSRGVATAIWTGVDGIVSSRFE